MVCEYGMSRYKNRVFNRQTDAYMSKEINEEITGILDICYSRVMQALKENSEVLKRLSKKLFESEILKKSEIAKLTAELFTAALEEN
jgi:cell division protease FtsH